MQSTQQRILYIEDHEDTRDLVTLVLSQQNYAVTTAGTVSRAVTLAQAEQFDLYLLDSRLPDGSGVELCKELRSFDSQTPILFYSAAAYDLDKKVAIDSGAQGYLTKPSTDIELSKIVKALIANARILPVVSYLQCTSE